MAFSIIQLANEPIVIITVDLPLDRHMESLHSTFAQLNHLAAEAEDVLYFVFDVSGQEISFSDILIGVDELETDPASWINFPTVQIAIAGTHPMLAIAKKRIHQHFRVHVAIYALLDDALDRIRDTLGSRADDDDNP
jgi:hypothetical protein